MAFTTWVRGMLSAPRNACMGSDSTLPRWLLLRRLRGLLAGARAGRQHATGVDKQGPGQQYQTTGYLQCKLMQ